MKTILCAVALLAAFLGLGPGRTACAQDQQPDAPRGPTLTWEQLARHAGLVELQAKTREEFRVDALSAEPAHHLFYVRAEIDLTAAEWARFMKGGGNMDFFSSWTHGELDAGWHALVHFHSFSNGKVDVSKIPTKCHYLGLDNPRAGELRLYLLVPDKDGKSGTLFYFSSFQRV